MTQNSRMTVKDDTDSVFEEAIRRGCLSDDPSSSIYAGHYMYMYHDGDDTAYFKHRETRRYLSMRNPDVIIF